MITLKKISCSTGISILTLLFLTLLTTTFSYFNWMGPKIVAIMKIIIPICSLFIGGFLMAKKSQKKGWLEGLKMGLCFLVILILFNLLGVSMKWEWKQLIYYGILLISSMFGGMIGINFKKK